MTDAPFAPSPKERSILLAALASYSANCTAPALTPGCPFYEQTPQGPACGEQCHDLLVEWQEYVPKEIGWTLGDGIEVHRRPGRKARRGPEPNTRPFDAAVIAERDKDKPTDQRHTVSLLMGLKELLSQFPWLVEDSEEHQYLIGAYLTELTRRGFDHEELVSGAADELSSKIVSWMFVSRVLEQNSEPGDEVLADLAKNVPQAWSSVADEVAPLIDDYVKGIPAGLGDDIISALTNWYRTQQPNAMATWSPPPRDLFENLPNPPITTATIRGRWIFDRFTNTYPDEWATSSLDFEWKYLHSKIRGCCSAEQMSVRKIDVNAVASVLASRSVAERDGRKRTSRPFRPAQYTEIVVTYLKAGRFEAAIAIYESLDRLTPNDPTIINNLAFCLIPLNPMAAEEKLRLSLRLSGEPSPVTRANLVFALYQQGRYRDALHEVGPALAQPATDAYLWLKPDIPGGVLQLGEGIRTDNYVNGIRDAIHRSTSAD